MVDAPHDIEPCVRFDGLAEIRSNTAINIMI